MSPLTAIFAFWLGERHQKRKELSKKREIETALHNGISTLASAMKPFDDPRIRKGEGRPDLDRQKEAANAVADIRPILIWAETHPEMFTLQKWAVVSEFRALVESWCAPIIGAVESRAVPARTLALLANRMKEFSQRDYVKKVGLIPSD